MTKLNKILFLCMLLMTVACKNREVSFTYSPTEPRAGQSIIFSNHTEEGEDWYWSFGDGNTSTSKSPSKVYKKPGTYTVSLKVDNKASRTFTTTITVRDTVPVIMCKDTIIYYYEPVTLTCDCYNPYGANLSYNWHLPEGTLLLDSVTTNKSINVCFLQLNETVEVGCTLTQGDDLWELKATYAVKDTLARAIWTAAPGRLTSQRIFKKGFEEEVPASVDAAQLSAPAGLAVVDDKLYIFNNGQAGIVRYEPAVGSWKTVVAGEDAATGFRNGSYTGGKLYWTNADKLYGTADKTNLQLSTLSPLYTAQQIKSSLPAGQEAGGMLFYNNTYMYAYAQGLHCFHPELEGTPEACVTVLDDQTIRAMTIDRVARKIYFVADGGLFVATMNGQHVQLIDADANGNAIAVGQDVNMLFWTTNKGVRYMPLVQSDNNRFTQTPLQLNEDATITALAVDPTPRKRY